jgi:two-component system sensor histidine kinase RegB
VRLRWGSVLALAAAAWAAHTFWHVRLPALSLIALAALAATNAALAFQLRSPAPRRAVVGAVLLVDVGLLTGILYLVGGPINPFSIVYLVGITVAAVALGYRWAIALGIVSNVAYGFTFFHHHPLEFVDPSTSGAVLTLHLYGMWVAFGAATGLIAYFVGRVSEALAERERELTAARAAASKSERLAALFALGAGAAHELATPLSTISTAAGELERAMARRGSLAGAPSPRADRQAHSLPLVRSESDYITIIRGEVERCTRVLDQLSGRASPTSPAESQILVSQLMTDVRYRLGDSLAQRLDIRVAERDQLLPVPAEPLRQVLVALLRNAFDASSADQRVALLLSRAASLLDELGESGRFPVAIMN